LQISPAHGKYSVISAQNPGDDVCTQKPYSEEYDRKNAHRKSSVGKNEVHPVSLSLAFGNGISCGAANTQHQSAAVNEAVNRNRQV
jgi:hypothetical protein